MIDKTGGLFRLAVGLMQAFATQHQHTDFVPLVNNLGLYFQIRDDLINLADEEYFKSKSYCEDLTEGKFSYPIIHCIRSNDDGEINNDPGNNFTMSSRGNQLYNILKQRTEDVDVKRYAQRLMFESGSLDYTREKCTQLKMEVIGQIEDFPQAVQENIIRHEKDSLNNSNDTTIWIALSYGGRADILQAVNKAIAEGESVNEEKFSKFNHKIIHNIVEEPDEKVLQSYGAKYNNGVPSQQRDI